MDKIEYGKFIVQVKTSPLATWTTKGRPQITTSGWPIMVKDANRADVTDARFVASHWFANFDDATYRGHQMPDPVETVPKPVDW